MGETFTVRSLQERPEAAQSSRQRTTPARRPVASIEAIHSRQILDSLGNPILEVEVALDDRPVGRA